MSSKKIGLILATLGLVAVPTLAQKQYPQVGRFKYDGDLGVTIYFTFQNPGGWTTSNPGLEVDLDLGNGFFTSCTSWTDLPDYYDDCPTAGTFESNPSRKSFGFGTFSAASIQPNHEYRGWWSFSQGPDSLSTFSVSSQTVENRCGGIRSIWCMFSAPAPSYFQLTDPTNQLQKGTEHLRRWWWTANTASSGAWIQEPQASYYYSRAGRHVGYVKGPAGTDFDLYLFKWNGSSWVRVTGGSTTSNIENVIYDGSEGYYTWNVNAYSGSGSYTFGVDYPSPPGTTP